MVTSTDEGKERTDKEISYSCYFVAFSIEHIDVFVSNKIYLS